VKDPTIAIAEFLDAAAGARSLGTCLTALARAVPRLVDDVVRASVLLRDWETGKVRLVAFIGEAVSFEGDDALGPDALPIRVLRSQEVIRWDLDSFDGVAAPAVVKLGVRASVHVPLQSGDTTYGVLNVGCSRKMDWDDALPGILSIARIAGAQIRLLEQLEVAWREEQRTARLVERLSAVAELGRVLMSYASDRDVLMEVRNRIGDVAEESAVAVFLVEEGGLTIWPMAEDSPFTFGQPFDPTGTLTEHALQKGGIVHITESDCAASPYLPVLERLGFRSLLYLPIEAGGHRLGLLCTASTKPSISRPIDHTLASHLAGTIGAALLAARSRRRLDESRKLAEQAATQRASFLAVMAHELRTPLHAVVATSQLLATSKVPPHLRVSVDTIRTSGETLSSLIDDVLDFSKNEGGGLVLRPEPFDLAAMVREVVAVARHRHTGGQGDVRFIVDNQLAGSLFHADPVRVRQVLLNLVSNAAKFTEEGDVVVRLRLCECPDGIIIDVADAGPGIPKRALPGLFEAFCQVETGIARRHGGTGLGLAITKQIVDAMDGTIHVQTKLGVGSTFSVRLPGVRTEREVDDLVGGLEPAYSLPPLERRGLRVLLVDDNPVNLTVGRAQLRRLEADVSSVSGARDALAAYRAMPFDLVLMDLHMPDVDGLEATRWLLSGPGPHAVVVALTADTATDVASACHEAGMVAVLTKPTRLEHLQECMERVLPRTDKRSAGYLG